MYELIGGDCRDVLNARPEASLDAIVTDPPYELTQAKRTVPAPHRPDSPYGRHRIGVNGDTRPVGGFMGKEWDGTGVSFAPATWTAMLRVAKPGAYLLAFGGTRTFHRMTVAIEDAGWEIRDCLSWLYGSGFPKSHNLKGEWDGWGTALKPAWEPIIMARKPFRGTVAANVLKHGTGAINVDACRIGTDDVLTGSGTPPLQYGGANHRPFHDTVSARGVNQHAAGRWPPNVALDEEAAAMLDEMTGTLHSQNPLTRQSKSKKTGVTGFGTGQSNEYSDSGGASRFYYCAKASTSERNLGLTGPAQAAGVGDNRKSGDFNQRLHRDNRGAVKAVNVHPTVKPLALMMWLVRMVTPPDGTVCDPFMGSGTTGVAAILEDRHFLGIELTPEYLDIARARIAHYAAMPRQAALALEGLD